MSSNSRVRVWLLLGAAVLLWGVVTVVHIQAQRNGRPDPISDSLRRYLLAPSLSGIGSVVRWWRQDVLSLFRGPQLARENARLRAQDAVLQQQNRTLIVLAGENDRLRALLKFQARSPASLLPAEVLALKPTPQRDAAIFSRGYADRVHLRQVALAPDGALAGQVTGVTTTTCDVLLLTDPLCSVGARIIGASSQAAAAPDSTSSKPKTQAAPNPPPANLPPAASVVGICVGNHGSELQMTDLPPDAAVHVGDRIVTSGLGDVYPKDIPIGKVVSITFDAAHSQKSAWIQPDADLNHLQEGFLLR